MLTHEDESVLTVELPLVVRWSLTWPKPLRVFSADQKGEKAMVDQKGEKAMVVGVRCNRKLSP